VEERALVLEYQLRDETIDGAPDRDSLSAAVVQDTSRGGVASPSVRDLEETLSLQIGIEQFPLPLVLGALEELLPAGPRKEKRKRLLFQITKSSRGFSLGSFEKIDQNGCVDDDHFAPFRKAL
jgi:hypothetical protein